MVWNQNETEKLNLLYLPDTLVFRGGYAIFVLLGITDISLTGFLDVFQISNKGWFVKAYLLLMIIAPILNVYSEKADEKTQRYVMIGFLLFEAIYGWVCGARPFFVNGYDPLHFIGIYITAQYIHRQLQKESVPNLLKCIFELPKGIDLSIYLITVLINTALVFYGSLYFGKVNPIYNAVYAYSNPLVFIGGVYLFLFFSKIKIPYVKAINWLGASSFAVYLFHSESTVRSHFFTPQVQCLYEHFNGGACISMIFLFLCFIYIVSVLIDQIRILSWNYFNKNFLKL